MIPGAEEVLVTEKRSLLVEEVRLTRIEGTRRETQNVTERTKDIAIERLAAEANSLRQASTADLKGQAQPPCRALEE